jgi:hypothetical protein
MPNRQYRIEDLLDRVHIPVEEQHISHRYELRRQLLCSKYFSLLCVSDRAGKFFAYTAPLFAGTLLVVVFATVGSTVLEQGVSVDPVPSIDTTHVVSAEQLSKITFIPAEPLSYVHPVEFIDSRARVPVYESMRFVPVESATLLTR